MNLSELSQELSRLGLEDKEIQVLASLYLTGPRTATQIAENSGVKRTHAYNVLRSLCEKRLVFETIKNKVKKFSPAEPPRLTEFLSEKIAKVSGDRDAISQIVPALQLLTRSSTRKPEVRFFWGTDGLLSIYNETLKCKKKVIHAFCDFQLVFPADRDPSLNSWMWEYADRRADAGIEYRGIVNESPASDIAAKKGVSQKRILKKIKEVNLPAEINIFDNKIAFMSSYENFVGIVIQDQGIADTLLSIHGLLWALLPSYLYQK